MIGPMITYDLAQTIHEDRLEKAAQARLINNFKTASSLPQFKNEAGALPLRNFSSRAFNEAPIQSEERL